MARRLAHAVALLLLAVAASTATASGAATVPQTVDVTDHHFVSTLAKVVPATPGVRWRVLDYNDELQLTNRSRATVTVYGYSGEPYLQIAPDGAVRINENSPAYYLNQTFYSNPSAVPSSASSSAPPDWITLARTGTFAWHDHRIHWFSASTPPQVRDVHKRTFVMSWTVPIKVGSERGHLQGALYWLAEKRFSVPIAAVIAFVVIVLGGALAVVAVRRRRGPVGEAW